MRQIFVSHNVSADGEAARTLRSILLEHELADRVFLSSDHDRPEDGTSWRSWISTTIGNADLLIFVASEASSSSPWCSAELGMARALNTPVLPLRTEPETPVNLVVTDLQAGLLDQPAADLAHSIDRIVGQDRDGGPSLDPHASPYPGLDPLDEDQEALMFGRRDEAAGIVASLRASTSIGVVVLSGPSGSGKSSLVRAGVLPQLRRDGLLIDGPWLPRQLAADLDEAGSEGLLERANSATSSLIVIDQGEELAVLDPSARQRVEEWIDLRMKSGDRLLVAIRSEFRPILDAVFTKPRDHYLPVLRRETLYDVIRGPAQLTNLGLDPGLAERLVGETDSGEALPLLALTLQQLWKDRDTEHDRLTMASLDRLGGVEGVLEGLAAGALDQASQGQPEVTGRVLGLLSRLAEPDQDPITRRPIRIASLSEEERSWIDPFVDVGLVSYRKAYAIGSSSNTRQRPEGRDLADVTHESLFRWTPLADAIKENRKKNRERASIERIAIEWHDGGQNDETLLVAGQRLAVALSEFGRSEDINLQTYLQASKRHQRDRNIRQTLTAVIGVLAIVAGGLAMLAWTQRNLAIERGDKAEIDRETAEVQRDLAQLAEERAREAEVTARSLRIVAQSAALLDEKRDTAMLAAVAGFRVSQTADAEAALFNVLAAPEGPVAYHSAPGWNWSTLTVLDRERGLVIGIDGQPYLTDLLARTKPTVISTGNQDSLLMAEVVPVEGTSFVAYRAAGPGRDWTLGLFDLNGGPGLRIAHSETIQAIAVAPDLLAFADGDGGVYVVGRTGTDLAEPVLIDNHGARVTDLDISRGAQYVASASARGISLVAQTDAGWAPPQQLFEGAPGGRNAEYLAFGLSRGNPETTDLIAAGTDPQVRRWAIGPDSVSADVMGRHPGTVKAIVAAPDSTVMFTAGQVGIERWDLATGTASRTTLLHHRADVTKLSAWDSNRIISVETGMAVVWDLATTRVVEQEGLIPESWKRESIASIVYGDGPLAVVTNDGHVMVNDGPTLPAPSGVRQAWWVDGDGDSRTLVFERRSLSMVTGGIDVLRLTGDRTDTMAVEVDALAVVSCLVVTASGQSITFHDAGSCGETPAPIDLEIDADRVSVVAIQLATGGSLLTVATSDDTVTTYNIETGLPVATQQTADQGRGTAIITGLSLLADGSTVVGRDIGGTGHLLTVDNNAVELPWHDDAVRWIAEDAGGRRLFMGGEDGFVSQTLIDDPIRLVNTFTAERRSATNDDSATLRGMQYLEDTSALLTVQGFHITAWELRPEVLIERICRLVGRDISDSERILLGAGDETEACPQA